MATHDMPEGEITMGQAIVTSDGHEIGRVKEIEQGTFKVDASLQPDYWLRLENATSDGETVRLAFPQDSLPDYKLDEPLDMADADAVSPDYIGNPSATTTGRPRRP